MRTQLASPRFCCSLTSGFAPAFPKGMGGRNCEPEPRRHLGLTPAKFEFMAVVADGFEKLADRLDGTLNDDARDRQDRSEEGADYNMDFNRWTISAARSDRFRFASSRLWWERVSMDFSDRASATVWIRPWIRPSAPAAQFQAASQGDPGMMLEFTVGMNTAGVRRSVTVSAEDALIAALKVKNQHPEASINYVRRSNKRGDRRHPHKSAVAEA